MVKKFSSKQEQNRERIYNFYLENKVKGKHDTFLHFQAEGIAKSTIYDIIKRAQEGTPVKRIVGSGRIAKKMNKKNIKILVKMIDHNDKVSQRQAARRFECVHSHISKTLKTHTQIRYMKKKKVPKRTQEQQNNAKIKCGELNKKYKDVNWVIDDESYFTLSHSTINGNDSFYSSNISNTPSSVKYRTATKFESKILVWICFSNEGLSQPYFIESGLAINQQIYLKECIQKRLLPFLQKYHSDGNYVFWPDLASSHYANSVTKFLNEKQIQFVQKQENPANVPECRPIEDFWQILKGLVYQKNWQALSLEKLEIRIKNCIKKIDINLVKNLANSVSKRLSDVHEKGVTETQ
ncbi:hypothetical protein ABPG72_021790 [Tetrahymena utriculariae]